MFRVVLYIILASFSTFVFCVGKEFSGIPDQNCDGTYFFTPMVFGAIFPVGWAIYAPYIAAVWFINNRRG